MKGFNTFPAGRALTACEIGWINITRLKRAIGDQLLERRGISHELIQCTFVVVLPGGTSIWRVCIERRESCFKHGIVILVIPELVGDESDSPSDQGLSFFSQPTHPETTRFWFAFQVFAREGYRVSDGMRRSSVCDPWIIMFDSENECKEWHPLHANA